MQVVHTSCWLAESRPLAAFSPLHDYTTIAFPTHVAEVPHLAQVPHVAFMGEWLQAMAHLAFKKVAFSPCLNSHVYAIMQKE